MGKKKKAALPKPAGEFSVEPQQVMEVLRVRSQYDKELRIHIEAAQWEAVATKENNQRVELEAKLIELQEEKLATETEEKEGTL